MTNFLRLHLHPLGGRIIFWNFVLLLLVKLIIPHSAFQSASLLGLVPTFDSREVITATNQARTANNLPVLKPNAKLDLAASEKLNDMAIQEYFAHVSPSGVSPWYWIKNSQYQYSVAGENLAIGFVTADATVRAWLNSPSHKANLLNNQYRDIGVAVKTVEINGREGILVVQMFGKPSTQVVAVTKTPTPAPTRSPAITPRLAVSSPETRGESVALAQEISTDNSAQPVQEPMTVRSHDAESFAKTSAILNNVYSIYVLAIAATSAIAFFFFRREKSMAYKLAFNFGLFLLAVLIPASQISLEGLIF